MCKDYPEGQYIGLDFRWDEDLNEVTNWYPISNKVEDEHEDIVEPDE